MALCYRAGLLYFALHLLQNNVAYPARCDFAFSTIKIVVNNCDTTGCTIVTPDALACAVTVLNIQ